MTHTFVPSEPRSGESKDAALKRIRAARVARRFPLIFEAIAEGRMHVSGVVMLAPHLTETNVEEVLAAAAHRTRAELEELVARLAPKHDLPAWITRIDPEAAEAAETAGELAPGPPPGGTGELAPGPPPAPSVREATRAKVLAPGRYALRVTIGQETHDKLVRAQALLRHRRKFGKAPRPREAKARGDDAAPRYVPREVRRAVHARDGEQCTFVGDDGRRCSERAFLELDHRTAVALGGKPTVDGTRILCHAHNQFEAERQLGKDFMRARREQARARRATADVPARMDSFEPAPSGAGKTTASGAAVDVPEGLPANTAAETVHAREDGRAREAGAVEPGHEAARQLAMRLGCGAAWEAAVEIA